MHTSLPAWPNGIDETVIGISMDGTGYGTDDNIWGGEFMVADLKASAGFHILIMFQCLGVRKQ